MKTRTNFQNKLSFRLRKGKALKSMVESYFKNNSHKLNHQRA